jgi:predicted ABC-type ATPase
MATPLFGKLNELTPDVVDHLFGTATAAPPTTRPPTFLFLVGAPGSGKSSGHSRAIADGILTSGNYTTINLDTLLESLVPFRASTAMAQHIGKVLSPLPGYMSKNQNMGFLRRFGEKYAEVKPYIPADQQAQIDSVVSVYSGLASQPKATQNLIQITDAAIQRAIAKRVDIVYETTFSNTKKFEELFQVLQPAGYHTFLYYIDASQPNVSARLAARQNFQMPASEFPFQRFVDSTAEEVTKLLQKNKESVAVIQQKYEGNPAFTMLTLTNPLDPSRLPVASNIRPTQLNRIVSVYGSKGGAKTHRRRTSKRKNKNKKSLRRSQRRL